MSIIGRCARLLASPVVNAAVAYNRTAKAHPVATGVITSGLKTSAADLFAQKVIERKEEVDWKRHSVFCLFGFAYLGGFQYWLYNVMFVQICEPLRRVVGHIGVSPVKVFLDQCIHHPFIYFPVFYSIKATVEGETLGYAFNKYRTELYDSVKALWSIWMPAQLVNFAFVPRHLRVPYVAGVSFIWTVILSVMQGKFDALKEGREEALKDHAAETIVAPISVRGVELHERAPAVIARMAEGPTVVNKSEKV